MATCPRCHGERPTVNIPPELATEVRLRLSAVPILDPGARQFKGFDITRRFESRLHGDVIAGAEGRVSKFYRDLDATRSVFQQWENFSQLARFSVGELAITTGLPHDRLGALATLFAEAPRVSQADLAKAVASAGADIVLPGVLLAIDEALEVVGTKAPIIGLVVQLGLFVYEAIRSAVQGAQSHAPEMASGHAYGYDKQADEDVTNDLIAVLREKDWTRLFLPQQRPDDVLLRSIAYTSRGVADGWAWEVVGEPWGFGLTPGLSSKFTGFVGEYQIPRYLLGSVRYDTTGRDAGKAISGRDAGLESMTCFGELHPSVMQFGMMAWQLCIKNGPAAFRIDGDKIVQGWLDHSSILLDWVWRDHIISDAGHDFSSRGREWMRDVVTQSLQWWDFWNNQSRLPDRFPSKDSVPGRYTDANLWWYSQLVDYVVEEVWRKRLPGFLGTLTCAYVGPGFPAIKADSELAALHRDMRAKLLDHPAVHKVEVDLIPDEDYRSEVFYKQLHGGLGLTAAPPSAGLGIDYVPPIDPEHPPNEPDTDPDPGMTPTEGGGSDMAGLAAALLVMAGALAAAKYATR